MRAFFVSSNDNYFNSDIFGSIIAFVQQHPRQYKMRDNVGKAMLMVENVKTIDVAIDLLRQMTDQFDTKSAKEILSR
jgi:transcription-repair coupling factor (superfamily II helicase)